MQLFITDYNISLDSLSITEPRVVHQLTNVLRAKVGYIFFVQKFAEAVERIQCKICRISKDSISCEILDIKSYPPKTKSGGMIITMPNRFDKLELMVQKLTEIGIPQIVLRPSHRSIIREISSTKFDRLHKIILEAIEQSRSFVKTEVVLIDDITGFIADKNLVVFDQDSDKIDISKSSNLFGLVGPEGGLSKQDLEILSDRISNSINLGENVLRMETAAIIGGWFISSHLSL